ncbi:nucleosome assembly protein 1;2-like [Papaver somniferum]|uniref:nucleosome assembly protein 1;2-like n=1 Tax=Papaver somniferum TaxID=3469 RepID=UPI000E6F466F|nr:nucleosome assembly protein 1;2-like [Papaver somniferum]
MEDFFSLFLGRRASASPTAVLERLAPDIRKRVDVLGDIQTKHNDIKADFFEKISELEAEYQKLYEPLYKLRYYIVNDDVPEGDGVTKEVEESDKDADVEEGVPNFWLNALKTNKPLAEKIGDWDEDSLKYLTDIKCCRIDTPKAKGFKLDFYFHPNPYFKNAVLTKTYQYLVDDDEPVLEKIIGTNIEWYRNKNDVPHKVNLKRRSYDTRMPVNYRIMPVHYKFSFFNFFDFEGYRDEEAAEKLLETMDEDYDIGSTIRDKIIPNAVAWFTGEAKHLEYYEDNGAENGDEFLKEISAHFTS